MGNLKHEKSVSVNCCFSKTQCFYSKKNTKDNLPRADHGGDEKLNCCASRGSD